MRARRAATALAVVTMTAGTAVACGGDDTSKDKAGDQAAAGTATAPVKLGLITKFPVDFYLAMQDAAKAWDESNPNAEVVIGTGKAATDDAGEIALDPVDGVTRRQGHRHHAHQPGGATRTR